MREILLFFTLLTVTGCSIKSVVHPFPRQYSGNPQEAIDQFEIQRLDDYIFIDPDSTSRPLFLYSDGTLNIFTASEDNNAVWIKNDSFKNPITLTPYTISAQAMYNAEVNADEFILELIESDSDTLAAILEGLVEDATVFFDENNYRFTALEFWGPENEQIRKDQSIEWHYYPSGGSWSLSVNDVMVGEIIQGSPVVSQSGIPVHNGISYTFLFLESIDPLLKPELINAFIAYLALVDMEYYYYECNPDFPEVETCPASIAKY